MGLDLGELVQRHAAGLLPIVTLISVIGIGACSVAALGISIERCIALRRKRILPMGLLEQVRRCLYRGEVQSALDYCEAHPVAIARILKAGLLRHTASIDEIEKALETAGQFEANGLSSNVRGLGVIANLAPMLGFLGTVTGMIKAFQAIAATGASNPSLVASGISEALITTAAGLLVGIPSLALFHFFRGRADRFVTEMEEIALELVDDLRRQPRDVAQARGPADAV